MPQGRQTRFALSDSYASSVSVSASLISPSLLFSSATASTVLLTMRTFCTMCLRASSTASTVRRWALTAPAYAYQQQISTRSTPSSHRKHTDIQPSSCIRGCRINCSIVGRHSGSAANIFRRILCEASESCVSRASSSAQSALPSSRLASASDAKYASHPNTYTIHTHSDISQHETLECQ